MKEQMLFENFEVICKHCKSSNIEVVYEPVYDYEDELIDSDGYLVCRDCSVSEEL